MAEYEDFIQDEVIPAVAAGLTPEENARILAGMRPLLEAVAENVAHGRLMFDRLTEKPSSDGSVVPGAAKHMRSLRLSGYRMHIHTLRARSDG